MVGAVFQGVRSFWQFCLDGLYEPLSVLKHKKWNAFVVAIIFIGGLLYWGSLLDWFNNRFDVLDWNQQVGPYLEFLSKAFKAGEFPLYAEGILPDRYLARQNRPFSPQILLLYFLTPSQYVLVNIWLFYSLGFAGLLLIRKRYDLSLISFLAYFLLVNINGYIAAHMGIGHFEWVGYFLLPFYFLLVMKLVDGEKTGWRWLFFMSVTLLAIVLQGAAHFFIYCVAFLLLFVLFQPHYFLPVIKAITLSVLISMVRILPPAIQYADGTSVEFTGGFPTVIRLVQAFIDPNTPSGLWERDYYLGAIGFAFVIYFGVIRNWGQNKDYRPLYLPMIVMTLFSVGAIYRPLFNSNIPFLDSQRVPSRFITIPVFFLISFASIQFQSLINEWRREDREKKVIALFAGAGMAYDLLIHSRFWSLENFGSSVRSTDVINVGVGNYADPLYVAVLVVGFACTIITFVVLFVLAYREHMPGQTGIIHKPKLVTGTNMVHHKIQNKGVMYGLSTFQMESSSAISRIRKRRTTKRIRHDRGTDHLF